MDVYFLLDSRRRRRLNSYFKVWSAFVARLPSISKPKRFHIYEFVIPMLHSGET